MVSQTEQEKFLQKIENLSGRKPFIGSMSTQAELEDLVKRTANRLAALSWEYCGLNRKNLQDLSEQELLLLMRMLEDKTAKRARLTKFGMFAFPIFGWIFLINTWATNFSDWGSLAHTPYYFNYQKLKKVFGSEEKIVALVKQRLYG